LQASLPVIWVAVGGRDSLVAVAVSTYALNWLNYSLSSAGNQYAMIIIGVLLVAVMMFFPRGIFVTLARDLPRYGWRATMAAAWAGR
jgi:ABC-type branched-subunit amino acid transport system permease subunit